MKKIVLFPLLVSLSGCFTPQARYTAQPLENLMLLKQGMSKQEVINVIGRPVRTELAGSLEAWHYCRTGNMADEFSVVIFNNEKVYQSKNYMVTTAQVGGATGDCSRFVRSAF